MTDVPASHAMTDVPTSHAMTDVPVSYAMTDTSESLSCSVSSTMGDTCEDEQPQNINQLPNCRHVNDLWRSDKPLDPPLNEMSIQKLINCHQKIRHEYEVNQIKSMYGLSDVSSLDSIMTDATLRQNSDTILTDFNQHQQRNDTPTCSSSLFSVSLANLPKYRHLGCMCAVPASQQLGMSEASLVSSYELITRENQITPPNKKLFSVSVGCQTPDKQSLSELYAFKSTQVNFPLIESKCCSKFNSKLPNMKKSAFSEKTLSSSSLNYFSKSNAVAKCDKMLPSSKSNAVAKCDKMLPSSKSNAVAECDKMHFSKSNGVAKCDKMHFSKSNAVAECDKMLPSSSKSPVLEPSPQQKNVRKSVKVCGCSLEHICNNRASRKVNKQQQCNYALLDQHLSHKTESSIRISPELQSIHANRPLPFKSWQKASLGQSNGKQQPHRFCKDPEYLNKQSFVGKRMLSQHSQHKAGDDCGMNTQHKAGDDCGMNSQHKAGDDCGMNSQHKAGDCGINTQLTADDCGMNTPLTADDCGMNTPLKADDCGMNTPLTADDCGGSCKNAASKCRIHQNVCGAVPAIWQHPYLRAPPAKLRLSAQHTQENASTTHTNKGNLNQHKKTFSSKQNSQQYLMPGKQTYRGRSCMCIRSSHNTDNLSKQQDFIPLVRRSLSLYDEDKLDRCKDLAETNNKSNYCGEHSPCPLSLSFWKNIVQVFKSAYSTASGFACQYSTEQFSHGSQVDAPDYVCFLKGKDGSLPAGCCTRSLDKNICYTYPHFYNPTGNRKVNNTRSRFGGYLKTKQSGKKQKEIEGNINSKPSSATVTVVHMYKDLQILKKGLRPLLSKNNLDTEVKYSYLQNSTAGEGRGYKQIEDSRAIRPVTCKSVPHDNVSQSQMSASTCNMKPISRSLSSGTPVWESSQDLVIVGSPSDKQLSLNSRSIKRKGSIKNLSFKQRLHNTPVRTVRSLGVAPDTGSIHEHSRLK